MQINSTATVRCAVTVLLSLITLSCFGQSRPKVLILTGNGNSSGKNDTYPPWRHEFQNEKIVSILKEDMDIEIDIQEDLTILAPGKLRPYDLIISNSIFLTPTDDQLKAVHDFVSNGKSFLTLHAGILSFLNWEKYAEFTGGVFIGGPSSEPERFKVYTTNTEFWGYDYEFRDDSEHPISAVVDDFFTKDELYYFQPLTKEFHVIARAENHPVMWWHPFSQGKVMNLSLGHDEVAKDNKGYQELLTNGVRWLLDMPLLKAEPSKAGIISNRQLQYDGFLTVRPTGTTNESVNIRLQAENEGYSDLLTASCDSEGNLNLELTGKSGAARIAVAAKLGGRQVARKVFDVTIVEDGTGNIASYFGNTVKVSSSENSSQVFAASNLVDNDLSTRWSSDGSETAAVTVDLKKHYSISKMTLRWEESYASAYNVLCSEDGEAWQDVMRIENGDGGEDVFEFDPVDARFVRIEAVKKAPEKWGYSLYEIEIYR